MAIGTVNWFNDTKGFGFITPEDGGKDPFRGLLRDSSGRLQVAQRGARVQFVVKQGAKGPQPTEIALVV